MLDSRPRGHRFATHWPHCVVSLSKTHLSLLSTGSTQEDPSQHNQNIVDWDINNPIKQTNIYKQEQNKLTTGSLFLSNVMAKLKLYNALVCYKCDICTILSFTFYHLVVPIERSDPCLTKPCENSGICRKDTTIKGFECVCRENYQGRNCETSECYRKFGNFGA